MDNMNNQLIYFLDLSEAFDTLDHHIYINKLEYYGRNGMSIKLMESYLSQMKQYVEIDDSVFDYWSTTGSHSGVSSVIYYLHE